MTKEQLLSAIAKNTDTAKPTVEKIYSSLLGLVSTEIGRGEILLPGIGRFTVAFRAGRKGTNPNTGEKIDIPAKKSIKFRAIKTLRDIVNG